jgi:Triose-phosphate Transporter family
MFATVLALVSISVYFVLNLIVTITNRIIITQTSSPYLLTASHAAASYISTTALARCLSPQPSSVQRTPCTNAKLAVFSLLFTFNIALSNYTLGLVSLPVHQTIRATAPALTILFMVCLGLRNRHFYTNSTYLSLGPVIFGVILATHGGRHDASFVGLLVTFLGAVSAVLKTIATHTLQTHLDIKSSELIRQTAPLALLWSLGMAYHYEETFRFTHLPKLKNLASGEPWTWLTISSLGGLMLVNALLAAGLNLASFEANRRCGPVSMGVAANLKQVVILLIPLTSGKGPKPGPQVFVGGMMTVAGGMWYAFVQSAEISRSGQAIRIAEGDERPCEKVKDDDIV